MKRKIALCFCFAFLLSLVLALSVGAVSVTSGPEIPADLTGYTVTVPEYWSSGVVGQFYLTGSFNGVDGLTRLDVGYDNNGGTIIPSRDTIVYFINDVPQSSISGPGFTFTITGGSDATNINLIDWLYAAGAEFVYNGGGDTTLYPIAPGYYAYGLNAEDMPSIDGFEEGTTLVYPVPEGSMLYLNEAYDSERGYEILIQGIVIQVTNIVDSNNYQIRVGVWYADDEVFTPDMVFTIVCDNGKFTKINRQSFARFYLSDTAEVDEWGKDFFDAVFVPSDRPVPVFEGSPLGYIISSINDSLRINIFGTFSIMDIVKVFVSLSLLIWILKLIAGG